MHYGMDGMGCGGGAKYGDRRCPSGMNRIEEIVKKIIVISRPVSGIIALFSGAGIVSGVDHRCNQKGNHKVNHKG